jgi:hypothetical protein
LGGFKACVARGPDMTWRAPAVFCFTTKSDNALDVHMLQAVGFTAIFSKSQYDEFCFPNAMYAIVTLQHLRYGPAYSCVESLAPLPGDDRSGKQ